MAVTPNLDKDCLLILLDMVQKLEKRVSDLENRYEVTRLIPEPTPCKEA